VRGDLCKSCLWRNCTAFAALGSKPCSEALACEPVILVPPVIGERLRGDFARTEMTFWAMFGDRASACQHFCQRPRDRRPVATQLLCDRTHTSALINELASASPFGLAQVSAHAKPSVAPAFRRCSLVTRN
jgi:hypothetical protein